MAPAVLAAAAHFLCFVPTPNQTASWVGSVVFEYEQPARRAKAISLLIDICQVRIFPNSPTLGVYLAHTRLLK
jgi:hypothetical protein